MGTDMSSTRRANSAHSAAVAKHVSADGCQLIVVREGIAPGQRFRFKLTDFAPVIGTVRWVTGKRVGFAFDMPIARPLQDALAEHCRSHHGIDLYLS